MIVATAHTPAGYYGAAAAALQADCERLSLDFRSGHIATDDRQRATRAKPRFMLWALAAWDQPFWFMDADSKLKSVPPPVPEGTWLGVHHQPAKAAFPLRSSVLYLTPDTRCVLFLLEWIRECAKAGRGITDHTPLVKVWRRHEHEAGIAKTNTNNWQLNNGFTALPHP